MSDIVEVIEFLESVPGIVKAREIPNEDFERVRELEESSRLIHYGVREVFSKESSLVIIKGKRITAKQPTLYAVRKTDGSEPYDIKVGKETYIIWGEEIVAKKEYGPDAELVNGWAFFSKKRGSKSDSRMISLPLPFPPLEAEQKRLGINSIVSTPVLSRTHIFLLDEYSLLRGIRYQKNLGSILIGYNKA